MTFPSARPDDISGEDGDNLDDASLLKAVLPPLLNDFKHWFASSIEMLETRKIDFLTAEQKQDLLERVQASQKQLSAAQVLSAATDSQAGIEMPVVMAWHKLVHECWGVALRSRREESAEDNEENTEESAED